MLRSGAKVGQAICANIIGTRSMESRRKLDETPRTQNERIHGNGIC